MSDIDSMIYRFKQNLSLLWEAEAALKSNVEYARSKFNVQVRRGTDARWYPAHSEVGRGDYGYCTLAQAMLVELKYMKEHEEDVD